MIATAELTIRHPDFLEQLPEEMNAGLEYYTIDREWQWVAEYEGHIVGQVLAAPMHGVLMLLRITATPDAPSFWAVVALRKVLREANRRGLTGYTCFLDDRQPQEVKLMRIVEQHGGGFIPACGVWAAGATGGKR